MINRRYIAIFGLLIFLGILPPLAQVVGNPYLINIFSRVLIYALFAVSLDLIIGYGGMVSFGHAAYLGTGAYVSGILLSHVFDGTAIMGFASTSNALVAWPLAIIITALVAAVVGLLSLRTGGAYFIMITLAFAQMFFFFFVSLEGYGGDDGLVLSGRNDLLGLDLSNDTTFYYVCFVCLVGFLYFCKRLVNSRFGLVIRGCKQNEERLSALGFPVFRYKLVCFVIAGAGAGLAGALLANFSEYVSPDLLHWTVSGESMVMVILGGMGTLIGPVYGAIGLLLLETVLSAQTEHWKVILGPLLILIVLFARSGIYGLLVGKGGRNG